MHRHVLFFSSVIFAISVLVTFALFPSWNFLSIFAPFFTLIFALFLMKLIVDAGTKNMIIFSAIFLSFMTVAGPPACRNISPQAYHFWAGPYYSKYVEIPSHEPDGGSINEVWKLNKTDSRISLSAEVEGTRYTDIYAKRYYRMNIWCKYKNAPHVSLEVHFSGPVELRWGSGIESWSAEIEENQLILHGGYNLEFIDMFQEQGFVEIIGDAFNGSRTVRISAPDVLAYLDFAKCTINPTPPRKSMISR